MVRHLKVLTLMCNLKLLLRQIQWDVLCGYFKTYYSNQSSFFQHLLIRNILMMELFLFLAPYSSVLLCYIFTFCTLTFLCLLLSFFFFLLSSRSFRDQSEEFSSSVSAEEEYFPILRHSTKLNMTRLDPPPHGPNPRTWMDEAQGRDGFIRHSGTFKLTENRKEAQLSRSV